MYRSKSYRKELSQLLKNPERLQEFLLSLMEDKNIFPLEKALKHSIECMGIKEFAKASHVPASNIVDFLKGRRILKPETLNQYLKPFRLKVKLTVEKVA